MSKNESIFDRMPPTGFNEPAASCDWDAFLKVVESRRSVRVYDASLIPEQDVRDCLRAALLAPNSSNLQPWEFHWVRSADKKAALVRACLSQPAAATASELIVCVSRTRTWRRHRDMMLKMFAESGGVPKSLDGYYRKLVPLAYEQGPLSSFGLLKRIGIFFAGLKGPVPRGPVSRTQMRLWAVKSTALACENLMLAFRAKGYDSCPMEGMDERRVRRILGLPRDADVVMVISAGRRAAGGVYGPQIRFDSKLFIKEV